MHIEKDIKLDFSDVLIVPKRSKLVSRKDVDLVREFTFCNSGQKYSGVPIIAANMDTIGTKEMAVALCNYQMATALHKHYDDAKSLAEFLEHFLAPNDAVFYSMGILGKDQKKLKEVSDLFTPKYICVDVANGYTEQFVSCIQDLRRWYPTTTIMAGNVVTSEMTEALILAGADIVKVGIGPGSVCTTRKISGVGYPQLSAVMECADSAHGLGGHICSDGGCVTPGDVAKAFGAGADFVMLGGMLAGHEECGGEIVTVGETYMHTEFGPVVDKQGTKMMKFYGMSSKTAMEKHSGGVADYRASEGKEVLVPFKGPVENTVKQILGGVRSACTYVGAHKLKELSKRTKFVQVNRTHNVTFGE